MRRYKWLLFDADGTLYDYKKAERGALKETFEEFDIEFNDENIGFYKEVNHFVWSEFENGNIEPDELKIKRFELFSKKINKRFDEEKISEKYLNSLGGFHDLIEDAYEVVEKLSANYKMAIVTNGLVDVQKSRFGKSPISKFFDAFFISEEMNVAKPDVKYFDMVFASIGAPSKSEVLIIGDSLNSDILGGVNYGIDTCWYNPDGNPGNGALKINYEIDNLRELLNILKL